MTTQQKIEDLILEAQATAAVSKNTKTHTTVRIKVAQAILNLIDEARVDELNKMVKEWGYGEYPIDDPRHHMDWEDWADYRIEELKK